MSENKRKGKNDSSEQHNLVKVASSLFLTVLSVGFIFYFLSYIGILIMYNVDRWEMVE